MAEKIMEDTLEGWVIGECPKDAQVNQGLPPEFHRKSLSGYSQERDGKHIWTSPIQQFDYVNKVVVTRSGTKYHLGTPDPDYVKWCKEHGFKLPFTEDDDALSQTVAG